LASGPRGPAPGTGRFLQAEQEAEVRALISRHTPDDLGLPFALGSRAAVRELIERHCAVRLAVRTMSTDLARWGFTAQKPLRRADEPSPKSVRHWCGGSIQPLWRKPEPRRARSSGEMRPACAPMMGAAAASPPEAAHLWCAPATGARG
jgi:Winged helix-turn helix